MIKTKMQFAGVHEFIETVRLGSFTQAGLVLDMTGSAIGKSVTRLEKRLGTKLLHRTTRSVTPTAEGLQFFESWVALLDDIESLEQSVVAPSLQVSGQLHVHLPAAFGRRHVMPVFLQLAQQYPKLDLVVAFSEKRINLVDEGVDLVVRIGALVDDADLVAKSLGLQELVVCASPAYIAQHGTPKTVEDLKYFDCIVGEKRTVYPEWLFLDEQGQSFSLVIHGRYCLSDGDAIVAAAVNGMGITQLPTWLADEYILSGQLITVLDQYAGATMPIHAVWPRSRYLKPRQRVVIDALVEQVYMGRDAGGNK